MLYLRQYKRILLSFRYPVADSVLNCTASEYNNCSASEYLVMGDTFQKEYIMTLQQLSSLKYVTRIVQAHFE